MALYDKKILKLSYESEDGEVKIKLKATTDALHLIANEWVKGARQVLSDKDKNASGALSRSLGVKVGVKGDRIINLALLGMPYGPFVDKGVQGAGPYTPPKFPSGRSTKPYVNRAPGSPFKFGSGTGGGSIRLGILSWLQHRRFQFRDDRGRFMSYEAMSYPISKTVYRYGIEPTPFIDKPVEQAWRKYKPTMSAGIKADFRDFMNGKDYPTDLGTFKIVM